ncbi:ABC transporter substrate-binding protein [Anaerobium acetethylicum]|uniref:Putative aldouronate transport system substrate-binding protein n=1 Tax=Anaerobium acetethylicum TaxID=1619234 RepID=A0A1D3TSU9_9FIRM|nr:ABC transporter substrate-binding protein [Anaerobium acetethylicum]SCP96985.1 putative aldouronate transport system substrate-binding protein [Anaerobium acetethylicum]
MKKVVALFLVLMMIFGLVACGKADKGNDAGQTSEADQGSDSDTAGGEITHLVMSFMTFTGAPADTQKVQDAMNEILTEKYGIEVELQISDYASYKQNMTLALSGGEQIDVFNTITTGYNSMVQQGYLVDLEENDLLKNYGAGITEAVGEEYMNACRVNGKLYGLPNNRDMAQGRGCAAIATEYLEGIGYTVDNSTEIIKIPVDELNEIYAELHDKYPDVEVYRPTILSMSQFSNVDLLGNNAFGVLLNYGKELEVENLFTSDFYKEYCARMYDYNQNGYISKDAATDTTAVTELVKAGTLMSYTTGGKPGIKQQETNLCGRPMTIFQTLDDYVSSAAVASFPWSISINTVSAEASMKLLNALYTDPDLANILSWGIEGTHYKVLDSGMSTFADGVDATTSGWSHNVTWQMPNQFITYVWEGNDPALWENIKTFNTNAQKSSASGFTFDTTNVATEMTSVQNVYDEYQKSVEYGFVDPGTGIEEMNAKMLKAGLDKIITEKQTQLDAWAAAK